MSMFGDHTPKQELLEQIEGVQHEFDLSREDLVILLIGIVSHLVDPFENRTDEIQKEKRM